MFEVGKLYTNKTEYIGLGDAPVADHLGRPLFRKEINGHLGDYLTLSELLENNEQYPFQMNLLFLGTKRVHDRFKPGDAWRRFYRFLWKDKVVLLDEDEINYICQSTQ